MKSVKANVAVATAIFLALLVWGVTSATTPARAQGAGEVYPVLGGSVRVEEVQRPNRPNLTCWSTEERGVLGCGFEPK
jgi:hypothetical protein